MKKIQTTAASVLMLCMMGVAGARADDASKRAKVEQLFTLTKANEISDQVTETIRRQMDAMAQTIPGAAQMNPEQKRILANFRTQVLSLVQGSLGWKAMEPELRTIYANTYSEEELDGMLAFFKSPVGQSMLKKSPQLAQQSMQLTQSKMMALQPKLQQMQRDFMQKYSTAQTPPASSGSKPK